MKKFVVILLALFVGVFSSKMWAQWNEPSYYPGDDLKGTTEYYANVYRCSDGYFVCWSNDSDIKIGTNIGIFDYQDSYVSVIIGFYEGDNLKEKIETRFYVPRGNSGTAYTSRYVSKGLGIKIINHLQNVGNVRIIAPRYGKLDFDITIPMNTALKTDLK